MSFCDRCAISYTDARTHGVWALQHTCAISNTQACVRVNDSTCMMYWSSNTTSYMCYHLHWCTHTHTTSYMSYRLHWRNAHTHNIIHVLWLKMTHAQIHNIIFVLSFALTHAHIHNIIYVLSFTLTHAHIYNIIFVLSFALNMLTYTTSYMCYHLHWRTHTYTTKACESWCDILMTHSLWRTYSLVHFKCDIDVGTCIQTLIHKNI